MSVSELKPHGQTALDKEVAEDLAFFADEIEYFETHDISEELANSPEVHFEINLPPRKPHFAIETALAAKLREAARQRGIPAEALLNEWVREKAAESETVGVGAGVTHEPARV